ncbi:MEI5 protein [Phlyctema vagabunda]|uniref:MEI5 protein n=1 Tax=Phlyctema vagabunda TaxID=108571 RepID=A0ABR4P1Z7_9HELO
MATNPKLTLRDLVIELRNLVRSDKFQTVASEFDEIPKLNSVIESKDAELGDLKNEFNKLKEVHENRMQEDLKLYGAQRSNFENEKSAMTKEVSALKERIQQRDDVVAKHVQAQIALQGQLDTTRKSLSKKQEMIELANAEITKLNQDINGKNTGLSNLSELNRNEKMKSSKIQTEKQSIEKERDLLKREAISNRVRLDEIAEFTDKLQDIDETVWIKRLDEVWSAAYNLVASLFKEDLPEDKLAEKSALRDLRDPRFVERPIPLPQSNSLAAKQMRIATLLATFGGLITEHIFQPIYIMEDKDGRDEVRTLLVRLARTNSKKESLCRALLLSLFPDDQARNCTKAMEHVTRDVSGRIRPLVSEAQYDNFKLDVKKVVRMAYEAWYLLQASREKFEPFFQKVPYEEFEWKPLNFEGRRGDAENGSVLEFSEDDEPILMIFPPVFVVADSEPEPVTPGIVLMRSQTRLAVEELEKHTPSSPINGRVGSRSQARRSRTMSNSTNGQNGFLSRPISSGGH